MLPYSQETLGEGQAHMLSLGTTSSLLAVPECLPLLVHVLARAGQSDIEEASLPQLCPAGLCLSTNPTTE